MVLRFKAGSPDSLLQFLGSRAIFENALRQSFAPFDPVPNADSLYPHPMPHRIAIGVTGGIAAYKVCEIVSHLAKRQDEVRVLLTDGAEAFVSPLTFATLARHTAYGDRDFWEPTHGRPLHIVLGEWAELLLIAPLTANTLAKLALGLADNLLTNTVLASTCPILLVPAMNATMWEQPTVQQHVRQWQQWPRHLLIPPDRGVLACDAVGAGRMPEPAELVTWIDSCLYTQGRQDLAGKRVLVSAGGTREFLDPVRFLGNPSTGKQGIAIAQAALHRGAAVTLVLAGEAIAPPRELLAENHGPSLRILRALSAADMHGMMLREFPHANLTVMAAAVGDVAPATYSDRKVPKAELPSALPLVPIPDILADLSQRKRPGQVLAGFAAQTGTDDEILSKAREKMQAKGIDAIATNAIDRPHVGFHSETNQAIFLAADGRQASTPLCSKLELAHRFLDFAIATPVG